MEAITIYPKNEKQKSLLKSLLEEMKIRFEFAKNESKEVLTEKEFFSKLNKSIKQAESGKRKIVLKENQKEFLGL